jgi:predicted ATPase/transcriptional regulator with XRE-family HTH domain
MTEQLVKQRHTKKPPPHELLRLYRQRSKFTQSQLASLIELKSDRMVRKWERGESFPKASHLQKLIELYLNRKLFGKGYEFEEARQLWEAVKFAFEVQSQKFEHYSVFDESWFENLLRQQLPPVKLGIADPPTPAKSANPNLPAPFSSLSGRETEIEQIGNLLANNALVSVTGLIGVGKSRLALAVAWQVLSGFPDGVWRVDLKKLSGETEILTALARILEPDTRLNEVNLTNLTHKLRAKSILLILDNAEKGGAALINILPPLMAKSAGLKILLTHREALNITGEINYELTPLALPDGNTDFISVTNSPAVQLFVARSKAIKAGFSLTEQNRSEVVQICTALDGLPLALELLASKIEMFSLTELVTYLQEPFSLLVAPTGGQPDLAGEFARYFDDLTAPEQTLLQRLASLEAKFELSTLELIGEKAGFSNQVTLDLLHNLINKALLKVERKNGVACYRLYNLVRHYAHLHWNNAKDVADE